MKDVPILRMDSKVPRPVSAVAPAANGWALALRETT
jgi:hypothetical protein